MDHLPPSGHSSSHTTRNSHKSKLENVGLKDLIYIKNNKEAHLAAKAKISQSVDPSALAAKGLGGLAALKGIVANGLTMKHYQPKKKEQN